MDIKITKQNFTIPAINVQSTLDELINIYPNKVELNYESADSNLQYFLWTLGWHCRIWVDGSIFTINRLYNDSPKIENEDPILTLTCLSKHMSDDSYIVVEIDGNETRFEKNKTAVQTVDATPSAQSEIIEKEETINITNMESKEITNKSIKRKGRPKRST